MASYSRYFSPSQVESDQKDLIVSQLKAEIFELRQNERDYVDLASQLRNLEHRYNLLQEEKYRAEADFKTRNEQNFKTIANLKTDVDTLKSTIQENNLDYQELRAENAAVKDISESRSLEITKLKNELQDTLDDHAALNDAVRGVQAQVSASREEKRKLLAQIDNASGEAEELVYRNNELEKIIKEIEYDKARVEKANEQVEASIDTLTGELHAKTEALRQTDGAVADTQKAIMSLESDIQELERVNERHRNESIQQQRNHQQEVTKNLELNAKLASYDNTLRSREIQLDDLKRELDALNHAHGQLVDANIQLNQDIDAIKRQIDNMTRQNEELVEELENMNRQDEEVRRILNRRNKISDLKHKSETTMKQSVRTLHDVQTTSPKKLRASTVRKSSPSKY